MKGYLNLMMEASLPDAVVKEDLSVEVKINQVDFVHFANTVVFYSKDDTFESFEAFIKSSTEFINVVMSGVSLMIRGAIAFGEFYVDMETNSYIGRALIDAHLLNTEINWMGLCFDKTAVETQNFDLFQEKFPRLINLSLSKTDKTNIFPPAVNWADKNYLNDINFDALKSLDACLERRSTELKERIEELNEIEKMIQKTKEFIIYCESKY
ncbi:MAG: hypothetical protein SFU99_00615 [Saprospiraceae bacterium]|nr:hypothetical protein [Saprospiraceae bacterium]